MHRASPSPQVLKGCYVSHLTSMGSAYALETTCVCMKLILRYLPFLVAQGCQGSTLSHFDLEDSESISDDCLVNHKVLSWA